MVAFTLCASRYPIEKTKHALGEHSFRAYLKGIKIGTTDLLRPRLRFLVYGVGGFASLYYAYEWGVLRPLILSYRGYEGFSASMLSFVVHCVLFGLYLVLPKLFGKDLTARRILIGTIVASLAFLALMLNTHIWLVGMTVVLFTVLADTIKWWSSVYINQHIASAHRATTLSVWAMLQKIPYIFLVGTITNIGGWGLNVFIMVTGGVVLVAALLALATYHHTDNKITGQL
jgi:hypothetical protein